MPDTTLPTMNQFTALVRITTPGWKLFYRYHVDYLDRRSESVHYEINGKKARLNDIRLGTFKALKSRRWIAPVGDSAVDSDYYKLTEAGEAAIERMIRESAWNADFAEFMRKDGDSGDW